MNRWERFRAKLKRLWTAVVVLWSITRRLAPVLFGLTLGVMGCTLVEAKVTRPDAAWAYVKPDVRQALEDRANGCGLRYFGLLKNQTLCSTFAKADPMGAEVAEALQAPKLQAVELAAMALPIITLPQALHLSPLVSASNIQASEEGSSCEFPRFLGVPGRFKSVVCNAARRNGLNPTLLAAQIRQESGFNPWARSNKNAMGIAQITGPTARAWGVNPWDPIASINAMAYHVARDARAYQGQGIKRVPALKLAQAQYNGGPNAAVYFKRRGLVFAYNPKAPRHSYARETAGYIRTIWGAFKRSVNG